MPQQCAAKKKCRTCLLGCDFSFIIFFCLPFNNLDLFKKQQKMGAKRCQQESCSTISCCLPHHQPHQGSSVSQGESFCTIHRENVQNSCCIKWVSAIPSKQKDMFSQFIHLSHWAGFFICPTGQKGCCCYFFDMEELACVYMVLFCEP